MIKLIKRVKASLENILKIITKTRTGENGHHFEFISKLVKIIEVETKRNFKFRKNLEIKIKWRKKLTT